ncbi:gamma-tubulin complex component protein [Neohortaea acidophila]|uniref:Spindle pole body component n=1 Tax=Neohortaea acidophila TaxID=245834 RepID=A0A6A6PTD9_9PEZI|nr:gamma-tubulin complex component protein [Neohortaea acidophila]KAF2482944.1 gamma-tubulin complex component protein [Neohortaea acidophila]
MLHEILLALSGHPSPLFADDLLDADGSHSLPLSPSEKALLRSIGQLADLHRKLRRHINQIASHHTSIICRAVATSIQQTHLPRFQDKIIQVERKILTKDAAMVGAYDIVPLAGVVGEFDGWHRRMAWYWRIACFMRPESESEKQTGCTGAALIDKLRAEQQTGFPDIEQTTIELSTVAETAWLRQVVSWVLYGQLPKFGADDFFIQSSLDDGNGATFNKEKRLLPQFVTAATASSTLFIGKSLDQVRRYASRTGASHLRHPTGMREEELRATHLQQLSSLSLPLVPAQFSRAVSAIRLSVSQNILQHLLPMDVTLQLLSCINEFFLLGRGEFAVTLINEAEARLYERQRGMSKLLQQDPVKALQGLSIKDAELQQTLSATWKTLAALGDDDSEDDVLDFARKHITLSTPREVGSRPSTSDSAQDAPSIDLTTVPFNDLLFPTATTLNLTITPPLDLFISQREVDTYATIASYLLAIRRAHLRLSNLWRQSSARRDHPSPKSPPTTPLSPHSKTQLAQRRIATRKVWATCSAALFLVSETSAYFEGEIIKASWDHFSAWVREPLLDTSPAQRDPESLASAHRSFLNALAYALLLTDVPYTKDLRSLLTNIDHLLSFFNRLLALQQKTDLERNLDEAYTAEAEDQARITLELDRARKKVDSDCKGVIARLRKLDRERIGRGRVAVGEGQVEGAMGFVPVVAGGLERLLMKLEFGRVVEGVEGDLV